MMIFAASALSIWEVWTRHRAAEVRRSDTAFQEGPLRNPAWLLPDFARLPAVATLGSNGLRFVARPELQNVSYAAAFQSSNSNALVHVALDVVRARPEAETHFVCTLKPASYRAMTIAIDERTQDFGGSANYGTDGTSLGFERIRGRRLFSGGGNFIEPYRGLGEIVLYRLREACPDAPLPEVGTDWYLRETFR